MYSSDFPSRFQLVDPLNPYTPYRTGTQGTQKKKRKKNIGCDPRILRSLALRGYPCLKFFGVIFERETLMSWFFPCRTVLSFENPLTTGLGRFVRSFYHTGVKVGMVISGRPLRSKDENGSTSFHGVCNGGGNHPSLIKYTPRL